MEVRSIIVILTWLSVSLVQFHEVLTNENFFGQGRVSKKLMAGSAK